jgi:hypothetical protein
MAGLLGKILSGVMVAGSSVLSIIAPPVGVPLLGLSVGVASQAFSKNTSDTVAASGQAVYNSQVASINTIAANTAASTDIALKNAMYQKYLTEGYTASQAAQMSGMSGTMNATSTNWLTIGILAVGGFFLLKMLRIIK